MKGSGIEWIGEIPEGWEVSKIGKHCTLKTGSTPPTSKEQYFDGDINWFTPMDFNGSYLLDSSDRTLSKLAIEDIAISLFPKYSILLVAIGATIGKIGYIDKEGYSNQQITAIMTKNIDYKYMLYFMSTSSKYIKDNALYTTLPIINNAYLKDIPLIIPNSFEEQSRIAGYLDKKCEEIDLVIKAKETTNEKLKEYRQSIIYETVTKGLDKNARMRDSGIEWIGEIPEGWEIKKLKYLTTLNLEKVSGENDLMYIGLEHIESNTGKIVNNYEPIYDFSGDTIRFNKNNILYGKLRPYLAKVILTDSDGKCSSEFFALKPTIVNSKYLFYLMLSKGFMGIVNSSTYGVKMPRAEWSFVGNLKLPIPREIEQQQIADYLDKKCAEIDSVISANEKTIEKLKEYRQSVIYEAVTGKIEI